ncbi:YodL domain-containing protein [Hungatella hathewayi]
MRPIRIENGLIAYYGNIAGHVSDGRAIVDVMFQSQELSTFLEQQKMIREVIWTEGIFERLMAGKVKAHEASALKTCRVWQLRPEVDVRMKFIGYDTMIRDFEPPSPLSYQAVFDGVVETNSLEELYNLFRMECSDGYTGHMLSISDVLELYDEAGSTFYYVDCQNFKEIAFEAGQPEVEVDMDNEPEFYSRIDREYAAYIKRMEAQSQIVLIRKAAEIAQMTEVYHSMRSGLFLSCDRADRLSQLEQPLESICSQLPEKKIIPKQTILEACEGAVMAAFSAEQETSEQTAAPFHAIQ